MSWVLAEGSRTVSISSVNGRCGGCAMVRLSGAATKRSGVERFAVELQRDKLEAVAVEDQRGGGGGLRVGLQPQRRAHPRRGRISDTSRSTVSTSQSGGR